MSRAREGVSTLDLKPGADFVRDTGGKSERVWPWVGLFAVLGGVFVFLAIVCIWLHVQQVQNGYRLSQLYQEIELHGSVQRKLILESSRFRDPNRLEDIGQSRFGLGPPRADQKVLIR